jgi:hypothetical protein
MFPARELVGSREWPGELTWTRTRGPEECLAGGRSGLGADGADGGESARMDEVEVEGEDSRVSTGERKGRVGLTASSEPVGVVLESGRMCVRLS